MEENQNIAKAMLLKESFVEFQEAETAEAALAVLKEWIEESELKPFKKISKRLNRCKAWNSGILHSLNNEWHVGRN